MIHIKMENYQKVSEQTCDKSLSRFLCIRRIYKIVNFHKDPRSVSNYYI